VRELADEAWHGFCIIVVYPKWFQSMQIHSYKGVFEMVCTVIFP
jgi:cobalamin biosynthesis Mg chelatase CobN